MDWMTNPGLSEFDPTISLSRVTEAQFPTSHRLMHRLNAMLPSIFIHQNDFGTSKALVSSGTQILVPHRNEPSQKLLLATFVCYNCVGASEMDCMNCWYLAGLGFCIRWYRRTWYIKKKFRTSEMLMHRRM